MAVVRLTIAYDGTPFAGGEGRDQMIELGSGRLVPGFEEQLEGAAGGEERTVTITFPEDYQASELAGREAEFGASGKIIGFYGFLKAYVEGSDDPDADLDDNQRRLPPLAQDDPLIARNLAAAEMEHTLRTQGKPAAEKLFTRWLTEARAQPPVPRG